MTTQQIPGAPPRLPPRRWVSIHAIERVTPRMVRLHLRGDSLEGFAFDGPGAHIKLILPQPGQARPPEPLRYEGRRAIFEDGVTPPFLRTYTPLSYDPEHRELVVELLDHGDSPASNWVRGAAVGDEIVVAGPRGGWEVPDDGDWYLVAADETALPAASQVLRAIQGRPYVALLEVTDEAERRPLDGIDPTTVDWLFRGERAAGRALETAIAGLPMPEGLVYAWVALEATAMRRIRRHLVESWQLSTEQLVTRGYWKLGHADHPDGDYGQEELA